MSGWSNLAFADNKDIINATKDGRITANIENKPLNGVLKDISEKFKLELKGSMVGSESVTLNASNLTLEEMLKKIMRGYNYVLIKPDKSDKTVLMVLSKAERTKYTEPSVAGIVVASIQFTAALHNPTDAMTVVSFGQRIALSIMLTSKLQVSILPDASVTTNVLVVVSSGKKLPDGRPAICNNDSPGQLSSAVTV